MEIIEHSGLTVRTNYNEAVEFEQIILMLHGWTGDERSMSIFDKTLPENALILSPRAMYASMRRGYSWANDAELTAWPTYDDLQVSVEKLQALVKTVMAEKKISQQKISLMGFSQGSALSIMFAIRFPEMVRSIAFLSGFFPVTPPEVFNGQLSGIPVYAAHGTKDTIVPFEMAEDAVSKLEALGAEVKFCATSTGHKVSLDCYRVLKEFFSIPSQEQ